MTSTIFITGSSTGLGRATALLFAAKGWKVIATMRSPDKETELGKVIGWYCRICGWRESRR